MSGTSPMSPNTDTLMTPRELTKTPKVRGFHEMIRSPNEDSLNTPLPLTTPNGFLSTPTLSTPQTADWGLFSPINLGSSPCSSPHDLKVKDNRPSDLLLDSTIGLSSPHDGVLAKRRKLKNLNISRSIESDSNSCDTPTADSEPRDLSKKNCERVRLASDSSTQDEVSPVDKRFGNSRDKVDNFASMSSPKWFKHPKALPETMKMARDIISDLPTLYQQSPLAVPSPNWTTISALMGEGLALKTPKVLDNFVFDVLPPNTPNTPKVVRERSPDKFISLNYERNKMEDIRTNPKPDGRVTFAEPPRTQNLTPPPPYPEDLSLPREPEITPKQEHHDRSRTSPGPPDFSSYHDSVKEEPQDYSNIPHDFPPYYLHPEIHPHQLYRQPVDRPTSPPASPPRLPSGSQSATAYQQACKQFYSSTIQQSLGATGLSNYNFVGNGGSQYNFWGSSNHHSVTEMGNPHSNIPTSSHLVCRSQREENNAFIKTTVADNIRSVSRLSTDSQNTEIKMGIKRMEPDDKMGDGEQHEHPPKKRGKGKGKITDSTTPKKVFVCPHCQRSYDWNYNLNRHLKYECGKENSFMCSKCGRKFPHKQNCVYHIKRKHKIMLETIDQYISNGLVIFQGKAGEGDHNSPSDSNGYSPTGSGVLQVVEPSPPSVVSLQG